MTIKSDEIPDYVMRAHAKFLLPRIRAFFEDPKNQAEYEVWLRTRKLKEKTEKP